MLIQSSLQVLHLLHIILNRCVGILFGICRDLYSYQKQQTATCNKQIDDYPQLQTPILDTDNASKNMLGYTVWLKK